MATPAEQHYWDVLHQKISQYDVTNPLGLSNTMGTLFRFYVPYLCVATWVSAMFSLWVLKAKYLRPLPCTHTLKQLLCLVMLMVLTGPCYVWMAKELGWYIHTDSAYTCFVLVWAHNFSLVATAWTVTWLVGERMVSLVYPSSVKPLWWYSSPLALAASLPISVMGILCSGHRSTQSGHAYPMCNPWWNNEYTDIAFLSNWYLVAHFAVIPALLLILPLVCILIYQAKFKASLRRQVDSLDRENGMILELRTRKNFKFVNSSFAIGLFYFVTIVPLGWFILLAPGRMVFNESMSDPHNSSDEVAIGANWFDNVDRDSELSEQELAALHRINDYVNRMGFFERERHGNWSDYNDKVSTGTNNDIIKEGMQRGMHDGQTTPTPTSYLSHLTNDELAARIKALLNDVITDPLDEERSKYELFMLVNEIIRRESLFKPPDKVDRMKETSHKLKSEKTEKVLKVKISSNELTTHKETSLHSKNEAKSNPNDNNTEDIDSEIEAIRYLKKEMEVEDDSNSSKTEDEKRNINHHIETKGTVNGTNYNNTKTPLARVKSQKPQINNTLVRTKEEVQVESTLSTTISHAQLQKHRDESMRRLNEILARNNRKVRVPQPIRQGAVTRDALESSTNARPSDTQAVYHAKDAQRSSNYTPDVPFSGDIMDRMEESKVALSYIINVARSDEEAVMWCVGYTFCLMLVPLLMATEVLFRREAMIRLVQIQRMLHIRRTGTYRELSDIRERWDARDTEVNQDSVHDFTYQTGSTDGTATTQPGETIALKDMPPGKTNVRGNTDGNSSLPLKTEEEKSHTCAAGSKEGEGSQKDQGQHQTKPRCMKKPRAIKVNVKHAPLNLFSLAKSKESLEKIEFRPEVVALTQTTEEKEKSLAKGNTYITNKTTLMEKLKNRNSAKKMIEACQNQANEATGSRDNLTKDSSFREELEKIMVDTVEHKRKAPSADKKKAQSTSIEVSEKTPTQKTKKQVKDKQHKAHKVLGVSPSVNVQGKGPNKTVKGESPIALQAAHSSKSSGSNSRSPKPITFSVPGPDRAMAGQSVAVRRPATPSHMKISDGSPPPPITSPLVTSQHGEPDLDLKVMRTPKGKHTKHVNASIRPGVKATVTPGDEPGGVGEEPMQSPTTVWKMAGTPAVVEGTREEVTKLQNERKTEFSIDLLQKEHSTGVSMTAQNVEPMRVHGIGKFATIETRKSTNTPTSMRVPNDYKVSDGNTAENSGVATEVAQKVEPGFPDVAAVFSPVMMNTTHEVVPVVIKDAEVKDAHDDATVDDDVTLEDPLKATGDPTPFTQAAILESRSPPLD